MGEREVAGRGASFAPAAATWGDDLLDVVEAGTAPDRFRRGEHLHLDGAVGVVGVVAGSFRASVRPRRGELCEVVLEVQRLTRDEFPAAIGALVRDPGWRRSRADGGVLGPDGFVALDTTCTCPDGGWAVCEHAIALTHEVALLIDAQPRHWLTARGLPLGFGGVAAPPAAPAVRARPDPGEEPLADLADDDCFSPRVAVAELPDGLRARPVPDERDPDRLRDLLRPEFLGSAPPDGVAARLDAATGAVDALYRTLTRPADRSLPTDGSTAVQRV